MVIITSLFVIIWAHNFRAEWCLTPKRETQGGDDDIIISTNKVIYTFN